MVYFPTFLIENYDVLNITRKDYTRYIGFADFIRYMDAECKFGQICYQSIPQLMCSIPDLDDCELYYVYASKPEVRKVCEWATKNILYQCDWLADSILDVRIRIAIGMINKLAKERTITKKQRYAFTENLVKNVNSVRYLLILEDLPF